MTGRPLPSRPTSLPQGGDVAVVTSWLHWPGEAELPFHRGGFAPVLWLHQSRAASSGATGRAGSPGSGRPAATSPPTSRHDRPQGHPAVTANVTVPSGVHPAPGPARPSARW